MKTDRKKIIRKAFIKTLPIMAAYIVLGMGFGILMTDKGYSPIWALVSSLFTYAGSMQYVTVDLIASMASPLHSALMTIMVNARHLFYGISMIGKYKDKRKSKPYLIFALTDETYSLLCNDEEVENGNDSELYCFLVSFFNQSYWVLGTMMGALVGKFFDFNSKGIDFSMTALFVSVFVEQWLSSKEHSAAITGIGATFLCLMLFDRSNFMIPAMILIVIILSVPYKFRRKVAADE